MAFMKRCKIELWSLGFAMAVTALFAERATSNNPSDSCALPTTTVAAESTRYLEGEVQSVRYDEASHRWQVTDGHDVAWLDARTGDLVELELSPRP